MKMHLEQFKAIVHFKDGSQMESEWLPSDIHARHFAEQFIDDENYAGYKMDSAMNYVDVDLHDQAVPFNEITNGFKGGK